MNEPELCVKCTICHLKFTSKTDLLIHTKAHFFTYECPHCQKQFIGDTKYNFHLNDKHKKLYADDDVDDGEEVKIKKEKQESDDIMCEHCSERFGRSYLLNKHIRKMHKDKIIILKPYICEICNGCFESLGVIKAHMKIHGDGDYMCDFCGKSFAKKTNMQIHVRTHTGEKCYHCEVCGKSFTNPSGLVSHRRIHTGEKPYKCQYCEKRYSHSTDLRRHRRTHTNEEKPFKCDLCDRRYYENKFLVQHQKSHQELLARQLRAKNEMEKVAAANNVKNELMNSYKIDQLSYGRELERKFHAAGAISEMLLKHLKKE